MDIYQCMTCGQQWNHGGSRESFVATAQHADTTRGNPEGMHYVMVGERVVLEAMYQRHLAGEPMVAPNDQHLLAGDGAPSIPEPPPRTLQALAQKLGVSEEQARSIILFLVEPTAPTMPESALDDVVPSGQLLVWGEKTEEEVAEP